MAVVSRALAAWFLAAALVAAGPARAETWFAPPQPRPDVAARLRASGENPAFLGRLEAAQADWRAFFEPAMLDRLAPLMQVYAISTGSIISIPDGELKAGLDAVAQRHVRIAFVAQPVIVPDGGCGKTEGYDDLRTLTAAIAKLKRLGIQPSVLALDGGLWFGHFATGVQECRLGLDQTIAAVAVTVRAAATAFPGIVTGDIEPAVALTRQPGWQAALRSYRAGLEAATGQALGFLELDVAWENPAWRSAVREESNLARSMGLRLGVILNGAATDRSDAEWLAHARDNLAELEGGLGLRPDFVRVASWNAYPVHAVGPDLGTTLASLLVEAARPGVRLSVSGGGRLAGRLTDANGRPLPGHPVALATLSGRPADALPLATLSGVAPPGAVSAIVGLRVNSECQCAGPDDVVIGNAVFRQPATGGQPAREMPVRLAAALHGATGAALRFAGGGGGETVRVTATPGQAVIANSAPLAVTPGAPYSVSVAAADLLPTAMFGAVTIIWLGADGHGLSRDNLIVGPSFREAGTATTDAGGAFAFPQQDATQPARLTAPPHGGYRGAILFTGDAAAK